jgi:superfamily I DNA/RNA helicase
MSPLSTFLSHASLEAGDNQAAEGQDAVQLMTIHSAKGLEFPNVYLIGAEDGLLPHERSKTENTVDEERRLFYVGITRAMRSLVITWCRARTKFGSAMHCRPSPFLREIMGDGVIEESYEEVINRPMAEEDVAAQFAALKARLAAS